MKQSLLTSLLLTLSLIFAAPPAWAERNTDYIWFRNTSASAANFYVNYYSSDKWGNNFQYRRTADASWTTLSFKSNISVPAGDSIKIRLKDGVTRTYLNTSTAYNYFNLTAGEWEVGGDLLTLISIEEPKDRRVKLTGTNDHTFMYLFKGSTKLVSAQKLKFPNKLNASCCDQMFNGCTGLVTGPEDLSNIDSIPQYGLFKLFMGCSKLENMPLFPTADSIGNYGCSYMFSDCIKLTDCSDQNLPATKIGQYAYQYMFQKCSTLVNGPDTLHAQYLPNYAYYGMFFACPKLQKAPVIKATSMNKAASNSVGPLGMMFKYAAGSSALSEVEYRMTSWYNNSSSDYFSTYQWLYGVKTSSENTFICSSSLTQGTRSTDRIPTNWIVKYYPIVTFRVSKDRSGNDTEGNWGGGTADTVSITGDWYGDGPFPTATHATKDFRGWVDADGKTITADSSVVARANPVNTITLYANFASSMNFTFDVATNGATWDGEHDNDSTWASGEAAAKVAANTPVKAGYRFVKWHTDATGTGGSDFNPLSLPVVSTTYYAIFVPLCTFNVNTNEGAWSDASTANRAWTKAELTADPTLLTEPVKANYHFVGWNTDKDATTDLLGNDMTNLSSDATTYYAIFTPIYTFAPNGGTWNDESTTDKEFYDSFEVPSIARNGYTFNGWEDESGNELDMEDLPSEPTTYTAQWTAINYTFDVATNEGAWSDESTADSVRTVSGIAALTTPKKDKFTFERWNTSADGTGTDMDAEALPSEATKYYAIFVKVDFFRFIAQNATTIATNRVNSATLPSLSYSIDAGLTWSTFTVGTTSVNLAAGDSILFKGVNASGLNSGCTEDISYKERPSGSYWYFTSTDSISVAGNIMTLVQGSSPTNTIPASNCFAAIMNNLKLVSAAKLVLPTTTTASCYQYIFYRSSVRIAPESLPALNVANYAYRGMFSQCTKLKIAPEIAATTVGEGSMIRIFHTCTALTQAPSE
ncbi:MAG: InlB B-repeat-containing protein, partial [Paludibacteraceae bacterium]|nr:InlB B-repeat-containing protein [Paludibacteraceae bacterium]